MPATKSRKKATAKPAEDEKDYSLYLEKEATPLQERFADWIIEKTGYEPVDEEEFRLAVQLATALRMEHQRSPENQEVLEAKRAEKEERDLERANKPKAKRGRPRKVAEDVDEDVDDVDDDVEEDVEETPKPARRSTRAKSGTTTRAATRTSSAKTTAAKTTRARRTRKPAAESSEAPF